MQYNVVFRKKSLIKNKFRKRSFRATKTNKTTIDEIKRRIAMEKCMLLHRRSNTGN